MNMSKSRAFYALANPDDLRFLVGMRREAGQVGSLQLTADH
jgi:hypothetical protein